MTWNIPRKYCGYGITMGVNGKEGIDFCQKVEKECTAENCPLRVGMLAGEPEEAGFYLCKIRDWPKDVIRWDGVEWDTSREVIGYWPLPEE